MIGASFKAKQQIEEFRRHEESKRMIRTLADGQTRETCYGGNGLIPMKTLDPNAEKTARRQACDSW